jgi:hypothetical protein
MWQAPPPAGDEVVICPSGRMTVIQEIDGGHEPIGLGPCEAMINPSGGWHTADVHEPVRFMTITPGQGTQHRPPDRPSDGRTPALPVRRTSGAGVWGRSGAVGQALKDAFCQDNLVG